MRLFFQRLMHSNNPYPMHFFVNTQKSGRILLRGDNITLIMQAGGSGNAADKQ